MTTDLEGAVERLTAICKNLVAAPVVLIEAIYAAYPETPLIGVAVHRDIDTILDALASITRERDAMREAGKPFFDLAKTVTTPAPGSPPWWQESQDWTVVFSFAGCAVTLGDLRRAAALVNGEVG